MLDEAARDAYLLTDPWSADLTDYQRAWWPRIDPWAEPHISIAEREFPLLPPSGCPGRCLVGICSAPRTTMGCGGCCDCMGGCVMLHEQAETAPHVWTGDSA